MLLLCLSSSLSITIPLPNIFFDSSSLIDTLSVSLSEPLGLIQKRKVAYNLSRPSSNKKSPRTSPPKTFADDDGVVNFYVWKVDNVVC